MKKGIFEFVLKKLAEIGTKKAALTAIGCICAVAIVGGSVAVAVHLQNPKETADNDKGSEIVSAETEKESVESTENSGTSTETEMVAKDTTTETITTEVETEEQISYTYTDLNQTMYAKSEVNVRDLPVAEGNILGGLSKAQEVKVTGQCNETSWYRIEFNGGMAYVSGDYIVKDKPVESTNPVENITPSESAPVRYDYYDINRDGIVTDEEIYEYGRVFNEWDRAGEHLKKLLKAGYYQPFYFPKGDAFYDSCQVLVHYYGESKKDNAEFELGMKLIDKYLLEMGYVATEGYGCGIDGERYLVERRNTKPITFTVFYNIHGDSDRAYDDVPDVAEEVWGYSQSDIWEACRLMGLSDYEFVEKPQYHNWETCGCGPAVYERTFTFEEIKAALGIE